MSTIRTTIRDNAAALILAMRKANGYNYDWATVQDRDETHGGYPRAIVHMGMTDSTDADDGTFHETYQQVAEMSVEAIVKLPAQVKNPEFAAEEYCSLAIDDILRLFGRNPSLNSAGCLPPMLVSTECPDFASGDLYVPLKIMMIWEVSYLQNRTEPSQIG